jgi:hypothetical protein
VTTGSTTQLVITMVSGDPATTATTTPVTISGSAAGLVTMLKISSFMDELAGSIMPITSSPFSVSGALNLISQRYSSGAWYVAASSTDAVGGTLIASKDGYVTESTDLVLTSTTSQKTFNVGSSNGSDYNIIGLPFALKVTAIQSKNGAGLSGATVTAGNSYGTTCSEYGSTGVYYCAIPLADSDTSVQTAKSGYTTNTMAYVDRSVATDAQKSVTASLSASDNGSTSSGGGGGYYYQAPIVTLTVTNAQACPTGFTCTLKPQLANCPAGFTCSLTPPNANYHSLGASFMRRLIKGISGDDVHNLQIILNSDPDTRVAATGAGSPGNETNLFGGLTLAAVQKFQVKHGIANPGDDGYGQVGPKTRAKLNQM